MKKNCSVRRLVSPLLGVAGAGVFLTSGCTHFATTHRKANVALEEHSRALTTGVVDVLNLQPTDERDRFTETALRLAREDQRIEGMPLEPIAVEILASGETNVADRGLAGRFAEIEKLLKLERKSAERLLDFGGRFEEERNRSRTQLAKWVGGGTLTLGGLIALCVFVPATIPILGRVFAWVVGKVPSLAGALGVVSVKAFDAVVKGVQRTTQSRLSNEQREDELHLNLSREMDSAHKDLVRARKATFN